MIAADANDVLPAPATRLERDLRSADRARLVVTLDLPPGVHIQSHDPTEPFLIPTRLILDAAADLTFGPVEYPTPEIEGFDWTPVQLAVHRGTIEFVVPITIAPARAGGVTTITGCLHCQACTDSLCLPPTQHHVEAELSLEASAAAVGS